MKVFHSSKSVLGLNFRVVLASICLVRFIARFLQSMLIILWQHLEGLFQATLAHHQEGANTDNDRFNVIDRVPSILSDKTEKLKLDSTALIHDSLAPLRNTNLYQ
jgi:hypothetical protein